MEDLIRNIEEKMERRNQTVLMENKDLSNRNLILSQNLNQLERE